MPAVICDTSPLKYLYQTGLLHVLPALYRNIDVPVAVARELAEGTRLGDSLPDLDELSWLTIREVQNRTLLRRWPGLGAGEKEVLALGLGVRDALVVLDDRDARREAGRADLEVIGTLGILLRAKKQGHVDSIRSVLDHLEDLGFWLSATTRQDVLDMAAE